MTATPTGRRTPARPAKAAVFAALLLALFAGGCGRELRYDLPIQKTLFYEITRQYGYIKEGKTEYTPQKTNLVLKLRVRQNINDRYSMKVIASPDEEQGERSLNRNLGENELRVDYRGVIEEIYGMGIPIELRLVMPELPANRISRGDTWTRTVTSNYLRNPVDLDLTLKYVDNKRVAKRNCVHLRGNAEYVTEEDIDNPDRNMYLNLYLRMLYEENIYFDAGRGYMLKMEIRETRTRRFTNRQTGESEEIIDTRYSVSELKRIE